MFNIGQGGILLFEQHFDQKNTLGSLEHYLTNAGNSSDTIELIEETLASNTERKNIPQIIEMLEEFLSMNLPSSAKSKVEALIEQLEISIWIHRRRSELEFSIRELGRYANVDSGYISRIERGNTVPSPSILQKLSGTLGPLPEGLQHLLQSDSEDPDRPGLLEDRTSRRILEEANTLPEHVKDLMLTVVQATSQWVKQIDSNYDLGDKLLSEAKRKILNEIISILADSSIEELEALKMALTHEQFGIAMKTAWTAYGLPELPEGQKIRIVRKKRPINRKYSVVRQHD